jgi:dipeptidase E
MKLFFTSSANLVLDKIVLDLPKNPSAYKVAFVPTAGDPYEDKYWQVEDHNKLIELGFQVEDFDLKNKNETEVREYLNNIDIIFVAGGNTFYLLDQANKSGFTKVIKELKDSDKIYIGSSAGSCIAGPDLEPIAPIDDPEFANLDSTKAFGLVDFVVIPHYGRDKYLPIQEKVIEEFGEKYKLVPLMDGDMKT